MGLPPHQSLHSSTGLDFGYHILGIFKACIQFSKYSTAVLNPWRFFGGVLNHGRSFGDNE